MSARPDPVQLEMHCPHCGLGVKVRAAFLAPAVCPRCLARRHVAQPLRPGTAPAGPGPRLRLRRAA